MLRKNLEYKKQIETINYELSNENTENIKLIENVKTLENDLDHLK